MILCISEQACTLHHWTVFPLEVIGEPFSDSDSAPVPKFLNPDPGQEIFQI